MLMNFRVIVLLLPIVLPVSASELFFIGHSLINHDLPRMVDQIAASAGQKHAYEVQIINGAPLEWQWDNADTAEGVDGRKYLANNSIDVLVMTEALPLANHLKWSDTHDYAKRFADLAKETSSDVQIAIFETWHCTNSGTEQGCAHDKKSHIPWRKRLDQDLENWRGIAQASSEDAHLIPGGQALARLHDEIEEGNVPGVGAMEYFFSDDIHLNDIGNYYMACLHYAVIYDASPLGLAHEITDRWGNSYDAPSQKLAKRLQELAWEVVKNQRHDL
mgnify:CR=1 FL=1